jgi:hypothetical protein
MLIADVVKGVNNALAGELLSKRELLPHLDAAIDEINSALNSRFPVFSALPESQLDYNYFPDNYIRTVVIPATAHFFYMMDEEGNVSAAGYYNRFQQNLFKMVRDYLRFVPALYQADDLQGTVDFNLTGANDSEGLFSNLWGDTEE